MITFIFLLILILLLITLVIFIPIGHESDKVRRLPWISIIIIASCIIIYILLTVQLKKTTKELLITAMEIQKYYYQHPYLELDLETKKLLFGERANEDVDKLLGIDRKKTSRQIHLFQEEEQDKLDQLAQEYKDTLDDFPPQRKWAFYPAQKSFIGLVTHMFVHVGFWHLIGNLFFLFLTGSYIEEVWGRPIYTAFYLIAGMFASLMHSLYYPNSVIPLVGSSGAVAGLMGAFLIRYWKVKIRFFWLAFFLVKRRTLDLPARVMLPLWLVLEVFNANLIDHFFPGMAVGGTAHWVHVWGFLFGVVVAAGMKRFRIEEKYINPKIEAQVHFVDEGYKAFEEATQKRNEGNADEAYALLLVAARKNPMDKDVVEGLWNQGKELGREKEAAEFYIRMIESEIRHDLMDVAFEHFADLRKKVPQASISMTCKFTLMTYLTKRQDYKEAKKLASELIEEVDLNSSPGLLQNFASAASEHSPEIAKKVIELCLKHPEITDEQKDVLKTKLEELQSRPPESPLLSDMGEAHAVVSNTEQLTAELESKLGLKPESQKGFEIEDQSEIELEGQQAVEPEDQSGLSPEVQPAVEREVQPLADSVGQTKEELRGQRGPEPNVLPEVEPESQPADEPEGQAGAELEGQQVVEPEAQSELSPEVQSVDEPVIQQGAETEVQPAVERKVQPLGDSVGQTQEELRGQRGPEPNVLSDVEPDKPERSPSPNQPIMAIKATPLNVKDGKIALDMGQLGQQLLPLNKVKSIAVAEIAPDQELPYLLIDLFLDDQKIRTIRILSTSFDATKFSPGIQDQQDALKVFVSVLLKLSGATAYADEDSILLDAPQSFSSIENYEKSILS